jgi:hypothetical protein
LIVLKQYHNQNSELFRVLGYPVYFDIFVIEQEVPYEGRLSLTVLWERRGEIPLRDPTSYKRDLTNIKTNNMATKEDYRLLIEIQWKDIHHSRIQEWSALGIISAAHIGLIQFLKFISEYSVSKNIMSFLIPVTCIIAVIFSVLGVLMVCRHRNLMTVKLKWISQAEEKLGLTRSTANLDGILPEETRINKKNKNSFMKLWAKLEWPRILSTSWLMSMIYITFGLIDFASLVFYIIYANCK